MAMTRYAASLSPKSTPCQFSTGTDEHREKGSYSQVPPNLGLVVRTIPPSSSEFHSERGREAIDTEIDDLRKDVAWDESTVCEWSEARKIEHNGYTPMSGLLFIIMGQKNSELVGKLTTSAPSEPVQFFKG